MRNPYPIALSLIVTIVSQQVYLLTAPSEPLAKSTMPAVGLVTSPTTPLPKPLKNPDIPSSLAPEIGLVTTPPIPSKTP